MILAIDGFNLIYKFNDLEDAMHRGDLEAAMNGLLTKLAAMHQATGKKHSVYVFFDGKRRRGDETRQLELNGLQIAWSHDLSADYLIQEFVRQAKMPADVKVVSSDRKLRDAVRRWKAQLQSSEEFAAWLSGVLEGNAARPAEEKPDATLSPSELSFWQEMFTRKKPR